MKRKIKNKLKYLLAPYPSFFIPLYRMLAPDRNKQMLVSFDTDIVIDGYPRSGNTFAVHAFLYANPNAKIAHHLHVESQILYGVRHKKPVLILLRKPEDAIRSLKVRHPGVNITHALKWYIRFYTICYGVKEYVVFGLFSKVTTHYGEIINEINRKFGTSFNIFTHTPENLSKVFERIEQINKMLGGDEMQVARPSHERQQLYSQLEIDFPINLLNQAHNLYMQLETYINNSYDCS